jgi:peptidoglycan/xylan/chitin deacetylase (PgdA/CDA1 family)
MKMFSKPAWHVFNSLSVLMLAFFLLSVGPLAEAEKIPVVIRYDDYCNGSDTNADVRILAAFAKRHIPLTIAAIPFGGDFPKEADKPDPSPLNEAKAWILREGIRAGECEAALHGYSHQDVRAGQPCGSSEFAGQPVENQRERMTRGKRHLEAMLGSPVTSFVPPWNTYDEDTVHIAKSLGMSVFSPGGPDVPLQAKYGISVTGCGQSLNTLKQRIEDARKNPGQPVVTALFHVFEISDYNKQLGKFSFAELESTLDWLAAQHDIKCVTLTKAGKITRRP